MIKNLSSIFNVMQMNNAGLENNCPALHSEHTEVAYEFLSVEDSKNRKRVWACLWCGKEGRFIAFDKRVSLMLGIVLFCDDCTSAFGKKLPGKCVIDEDGELVIVFNYGSWKITTEPRDSSNKR